MKEIKGEEGAGISEVKTDQIVAILPHGDCIGSVGKGTSVNGVFGTVTCETCGQPAIPDLETKIVPRSYPGPETGQDGKHRIDFERRKKPLAESLNGMLIFNTPEILSLLKKLGINMHLHHED